MHTVRTASYIDGVLGGRVGGVVSVVTVGGVVGVVRVGGVVGGTGGGVSKLNSSVSSALGLVVEGLGMVVWL